MAIRQVCSFTFECDTDVEFQKLKAHIDSEAPSVVDIRTHRSNAQKRTVEIEFVNRDDIQVPAG